MRENWFVLVTGNTRRNEIGEQTTKVCLKMRIKSHHIQPPTLLTNR